MVTLPLAKIVTGVLVVFFLNVTVTPEGIFTEVKLKIPLGGNCSWVLTVGLKAPSAPVLPLSNPNARPGMSTNMTVSAWLIVVM